MENEYFDEARRCSKCNIVTYCDSCPICGKRLPRSSYFTWKMRHRGHVAGEGDEVLQPSSYEAHQGHIVERVISNKKMQHNVFETAKHIEPKLTFSSARVKPRVKSMLDEAVPTEKQTITRLTRMILASVMVIFIAVCLILFVSNMDHPQAIFGPSDDPGGTSELISYTTEPYSEQLEIYGYEYEPSTELSTLDIRNQCEDGLYGDRLVLYDEDGNELGEYSELLILPYEDFKLSIYSDERATYYGLENIEYYEIDSTKPAYGFKTYNTYGTVEIDVEKEITMEELEILVNYVYEGTTYHEDEEMYYCDVYMPNNKKYEVFLNKGDASVYLIDEYDEVESDGMIGIYASSNQGESM